MQSARGEGAREEPLITRVKNLDLNSLAAEQPYNFVIQGVENHFRNVTLAPLLTCLNETFFR